jgi:hypothetical protein
MTPSHHGFAWLTAVQRHAGARRCSAAKPAALRIFVVPRQHLARNHSFGTTPIFCNQEFYATSHALFMNPGGAGHA